MKEDLFDFDKELAQMAYSEEENYFYRLNREAIEAELENGRKERKREEAGMKRFNLPKVEFSASGISPFLSPETMQYHYGRHHKTYVDKLNTYLEESDLKHDPLEDIVRMAAGPLFNNAAQAWNHTFYWNCLTTDTSTRNYNSDFFEALRARYGSVEKFKERFIQSAAAVFGSGWTWLVLTPKGELEIVNTANADNPLREGKIPLLVCDVWEHAYYIDYRNDRLNYLHHFCDHVNWTLVEDVYIRKEVSFVGRQMEEEEAPALIA